MAQVFIRIDQSGLFAKVSSVTGKVAYTLAQRIRGRAMANIHRLGRIQTAAMVDSLQVRRIAAPTWYVSYTVGSSIFYIAWQEHGTAAHGPRRAFRMVFWSRKYQTMIYTRWVRGIPPGYFMRDAFLDATIHDAIP